MGLFDLFKKKPRLLDDELARRLGARAAVNALVRGGRLEASQAVLAVNVDPAGLVSADRPTMAFRWSVVGPAPGDRWLVRAGRDDATASCRFDLQLTLPERPAIDPVSFQLEQAPGFGLELSKPADHQRNPMARSAFLLAWRVEGGFELPPREEPLQLEATVLGVGLLRQPHMYGLGEGGTWALLKCHRGEHSFWLGLDLATGDGEVFPRRGEVGSYQLALDFLCVFT